MRRANRLLRTGPALFAPLLLTTACGWDETKVSISTTGDVVVEAIEQPDNAAAITNKAPIVAGTPSGYAPIDEPYDFVPVAADPDGHKVEFSINNKPQWASFDKNTGRLSGTPRSTDAGLSRGLAGISGSTLVVNIAGSRSAVRDGMATLGPMAAHVIAELSSLEI